MVMAYSKSEWYDMIRVDKAKKKAVPGQKKFKKNNTSITAKKAKRK